MARSLRKPFLEEPGIVGARRPRHSSLGHSWQLWKLVSVGKKIPETVLVGSIRKLSVSRTPISASRSPSRRKSGSCWGSGQSGSEPGFMWEKAPMPFTARR